MRSAHGVHCAVGPLEYRAQVSIVTRVVLTRDSIHSFIDGRLSAPHNGRAHSADRSSPNRSVETIECNQLIIRYME